MKKSKISLIMKIIAVVASLYGMLQSLDHWMFFTYFTNLSNIFIDIMLVIFIIYDLKKVKYIPQGMYLIKFMATISITLTFLVYMLLLAPTNSQGFIGAYLNNGAGSLCVHFITPVLAIIDFLLFLLTVSLFSCKIQHFLIHHIAFSLHIPADLKDLPVFPLLQ